MDVGEDTLQKALRINLDPRWYGTIAEIGAGQEVARWFFRAGGAAGTIAKTMSAYDMAVSDAVYGRSDRYVSLGRLQAMLEHEYTLNVERLSEARGDDTCFFAFADTVVARSYRGGNECHGWMGVRFQAHPEDEPNEIVVHVRMLDDDAAQQQEALGIVGVNLLHAAFFERAEPDEIVASLLDRLNTGRIEVDMIKFSGIEFRSVDNRLMALQLVNLGLSGVAMFGADREVLQPSEALRKRPVLVERGSFRPPTHVNIDMLECAKREFAKDPAVAGKEVLALTELTMSNLLAGGSKVDRRDFLARADLLSATGSTVLISNFADYHRLAAYLQARTSERIGMVMGLPSLEALFDEKTHAHLQGGLLESWGRLLKNELKLFVYPKRDLASGDVVTVEDVQVGEQLQPLFDYLSGRGSFVHLSEFNPDYLSILSRDVLKRIAAHDETWQDMVPTEVAELICKRSFFGYKRDGV
ncbi:TonB-dependent receptor [Streptomyces sp. NP160]|uniref:TonB-dependent receptor n=1 Tax=Streptomyces sp. NP160 TaxID=2586637 RepID=UPI00111AE4B0|nr:TonB-dependent receptor [Streptomyces sp. NP160]TNM69102.1 TonB-dependent receptor [Streptomyces sp. NP160]